MRPALFSGGLPCRLAGENGAAPVAANVLDRKIFHGLARTGQAGESPGISGTGENGRNEGRRHAGRFDECHRDSGKPDGKRAVLFFSRAARFTGVEVWPGLRKETEGMVPVRRSQERLLPFGQGHVGNAPGRKSPESSGNPYFIQSANIFPTGSDAGCAPEPDWTGILFCENSSKARGKGL